MSSSGLSFATYLRMGLRNLWRNPRRTGLTLASLAMGVAALTFLVAIDDGWLLSVKDNFILTQTGHVQVHAKGFEASQQIQDYMPHPEVVEADVRAEPKVAAWSTRVRVSGLASVAGASTGVQIMGVDPLREQRVSRLSHFVSKGAWLRQDDAHALLLGDVLVDRLRVKLGDKVILMAQAPNGDVVSEMFRLRGILHSGAPEVDQAMALIPLTTAQHWLELGEGVTDVVIRAQQHDDTNAIWSSLKAKLPTNRYEVLRWLDIDPMVQQWTEFADVYTYYILAIVVLVVLAEVLNTMLMSMHERIREFGLMEALGTRKLQLFAMVLWESVVLVAIGGAGGYLIGVVVALHFGHVGIDLSGFTDAFTFIYMSPVVYPVLTFDNGVRVIGMSLVGALLAGLYPAWKVTRLNPVDAMREV